jgi:hypothetical protein
MIRREDQVKVAIEQAVSVHVEKPLARWFSRDRTSPAGSGKVVSRWRSWSMLEAATDI